MRSTMPRERMILARITVNCRVRFRSKRRLDFSLGRLRNELVLLGQMHQQWRTEPIDFSQIFFGVTPVIRHGSIHAGATRGKVRHKSTETISEDSNLSGAFRQ